jgi:hypothetical protein
MTNEELLVVINAAIADARAAAAAANVAAAAANQASSGAAAGVAGARTQSNVEQAAVTDAMLKSISQQTESDINVPEAWQANVKRTYDVHQSVDIESMQRNRVHFDAMITQQATHLANLNQLTLQSLANNQNQSNLANTQAINSQALSIDRQWNINETDLSAKSAAVLTDAILSRVAVAPKPA